MFFMFCGCKSTDFVHYPVQIEDTSDLRLKVPKEFKLTDQDALCFKRLQTSSQASKGCFLLEHFKCDFKKKAKRHGAQTEELLMYFQRTLRTYANLGCQKQGEGRL